MQIWPNKMHQDQRYFPRWVVKNRVLYALAGNDFNVKEGFTKDLSCAGACISIHEHLEPAQKLTLTIYLSEDVTVHLNGRVVWLTVMEKENYAGVLFYNTPHSAQELILEHAFHLDREKFIEHFFQGWRRKKSA